MRKLALFTGAFSAGIFLAQYLLPNGWLLPCAGVAFALACLRLLLRDGRGRRVLLVGAGLSLALGWNWLFVRQVQRPMEALAETEAEAAMTLLDYAEPTTFGTKATVRVEGLPGRAVYYGDETLLRLHPGQTLRGRVLFQSAARIRDEGVSVFTSKGVFLLAYSRGPVTYGHGTAGSIRWSPLRLGWLMSRRIEEMLGGDTASFLTAVLTGETSGLSQGTTWDLSEAGLYHILAVSGMHCGFLLLLIRGLVGRHRRRLLAAVMTAALVGYALLAGARPSMVRACVMLILLLAAPLFRRESDPPTALLAALFLILLKNPFAAASIGLQLSFGAVAGILWLTPKLYRGLLGKEKHGKVFHFIATGVSTTLGALVFTIPLTAYYFEILVLVSPLSNLLCLWAASAFFITGLVAVAVSLICPPLGRIAGLVPALFGRYILAAAHLLAKLPFHAVYFTNPYLKYWLLFAYLLFALVYFTRAGKRRTYLLAAGCCAASLAVTVHLGAARCQADLEVMALDVGQGQSVLLASDGQYALTDCGTANNWYDPGETAVRQLWTMGCRRLDYLLLTHYDGDHVSGAVKVLEHMPVSVLVVPEEPGDAGREIWETARAQGTEIWVLSDSQRVPLGKAALTLYPPLGEGEDNERGLSVLVSLGETDLLITGDMDRATERALLAAYGLPDLEYLVAGHHGSKNSTSNELLDALAPETVLVSAGANNHYGHPAEETLRRLAEHGCTVYRTDLHGTIHLSLQGDGYGE